MKRILSAAGMMLLMDASTYAATLTFAWDPMPSDQNWTRVRLYEKSGKTHTLLIEVAGNAILYFGQAGLSITIFDNFAVSTSLKNPTRLFF
jgi:hypothetical protein